MNKNFSPDKLRLARILKGYTLQEVGEAVAVTRQNISQFENGSRVPSSKDLLAALAEFLSVDESFFFKEGINEVRPEQCHFRKRKTTPVGVTNKVIAYSTLLEELVEYLHSILDLPESDFNFLNLSSGVDLNAADIEEFSRQARLRWGLSEDAPIDNMVDVVERAGAIVTCFDGVSDKVDALSVNRKYPLIIRNTAKQSICRMRFDLAHECGHLLMHDGIETGCQKTEREADIFASSFLFPKEAFVSEFQGCVVGKRINWDRIYALKLRWKVSARAIIYRANFLNLISAQTYRQANVYFSRTRQTRVEKFDDQIPQELPFVIQEAFDQVGRHLNLSFGDLSRKLGVKPLLLSSITGIESSCDDRASQYGVASIDLYRR